MSNSAWRRIVFSGLVLTVAIAVNRLDRQPLFAAPQKPGTEPEKKEISIKTPWGSFEASVTANPSRLGLPVYPGARFLEGEAPGSLSLDLSLKGEPSFRLVVAKFQTSDSMEKVREFYRKKLGKDVTQYIEKTDDGGTAFEIKHKPLTKVVQIKTADSVTEIDLVRIENAEGDVN
jgi:hypothetical protein